MLRLRGIQMANPNMRGGEVGKTAKLVLFIFALAGLLLILTSLFMLHPSKWEYLGELLKELGIVVLSVFSVSLIYELLLAEKHLENFQALLRSEIQQAETSSAACAQMGVSEIFPSRDKFESKYPFAGLVAGTDKCSNIRIIGISLFHIMNQSESLKRALESGAKIELCLFDPAKFPHLHPKLPDLEVSDIHSAVATFKKQIVAWIEGAMPKGEIELRYHDIYLFQSLAKFKTGGRELGVWDLSFGRDIRAKRIIIVNPTWGLGLDLSTRYDAIWNTSSTVFRYENGQVTDTKI
jgi:hypothetical protein